MGRFIPFFSAAALIFLALEPSVQAQEASMRKTLSLIPDDQAWGDVVENTQPCSVPGEASCSRFNASNKPLTPLQSFSAQSSPTAVSNQNDPAKVSNALAPALASLVKEKALAAKTPKTALRNILKNPPSIHGGNGTFITLPSGVQRVNQTTRKTLKSLSNDPNQ
jgi:hypothetical protein